jgi:hypothetical protein
MVGLGGVQVAPPTRSLTIGYSDNLCGCSDVVWTSPRDIDEHFGDEELVEQGKTSVASVAGGI